MNKRYFSLVMNEEKNEADINIFGDITSFANFPDDSWLGALKSETDYSAYRLSKQLEEMGNVKKINVHINSYGGEVAEGLAIYNALKNHKAKVKTYCDGFACSIASVIFMAGDERIMNKASLLMIHNAWIDYVSGNANELRKQAEDLDVITQASVNAYMEHVNISEEELKSYLDNESWLDYKQCLEMGFATSVVGDSKNDKASQSVRNKLVKMILENQDENKDEEDKDINSPDKEDENVNEEGGDVMKFECQKCGYVHEGELPEFFVCPECGASKEEFVEVEETDEDKDVNELDDEEEKDTEPSNEENNDEENENNDEDEEVTNQKVVAFFSAIAK